MKRWRSGLAGSVAVLVISFSAPVISGATTGRPTASEDTWAAVGIDIIDEGAASYAWDPAPGAPASYTVVLETSDGRSSATLESTARTSHIALPFAALHKAKTAWVVANYRDGREIRSEPTYRDAVDSDGPPVVLLKDCFVFNPDCSE